MDINDIKREMRGKTSSFDPFEDEPRKKKKKKKKHENYRDEISASVKPETGKKRKIKFVKNLSKAQLRDRMVSMGVSANGVDTNSREEMVDAIMNTIMNGTDTSSITSSIHDAPPHYFDESSGAYIIRDCVDTDATNCFEAMSCIGALRTAKRADDGFGEMMNRLTAKLVAAGRQRSLPNGDVIDVTDFVEVPSND